jgi:two-component system chemotaxis response regulator CheB
VITLQAEPALVDTFIARLEGELKCSIRGAKDGAQLTQGIVHIAADPGKHVVLEPGQPPRLRLMEREPIDGVRPSANLLYGTIARAGIPAVGAVLTGMGEDGAKGLKLMRDAGCRTLAQDRASATVSEAPAAAIAAGSAEQELPLDAMIDAILGHCSSS